MVLRLAIIQSNYVPWRGFFDLIGRCDEYVIYDSVQYAKRHWHNRNRIKTANGVQWLTIPVSTKSRRGQPINEVEIEKPWAEKHWRALELAYRNAPYFEALAPAMRAWYEAADRQRLLTDVNMGLLQGVAKMLGITTRLVYDTQYPVDGSKTARLVSIARAAGARRYLSGPSAADYLDEALFAEAGIEVEWMNYDGYPEYPQLHGNFEPRVSILDVLLNLGPDGARNVSLRAG